MRFTAALRKSKLSHPVVPTTGKISTFPAPTNGWNTRDPLNAMKPQDAIVLDNYFPTTADVQLRGGSRPWATGMDAHPVETVIEYSKGTTDELWAICNGKIYNVTLNAAVGAAAVSGLTVNRWQYTIFTTAGDTRIVMVNGADHCYQYDGAAWTDENGAITGVASNTLINVWIHQDRLFFCQIGTMDAWYLPVDSFTGAALKFDLGTIFKRGGYLMAGGTWTRDGGNGMDDLCVFISSHGEVAIFSGSDPADATLWTEIGRYEIGAPIGRRCLIKSGADLAVITYDGIVGLSRIISLDRAQTNSVAISDRIRGAFTEAVQLYATSFGWEACSYPKGSQVWFNIPVAEGVTQYQFVLNATTGAWCRFKGLNATTWCLHKERMYFGNNSGQLWLADDGDSDNGMNIAGFVKTSFIYHGKNAAKKAYKLIRPIIFSDVSLPFGIGLAIDFDLTNIAPLVQPGGGGGTSTWNLATWNVDPWATIVAIKRWIKTRGIGSCASVLFSTNTKGYSVTLNAIDVVYEAGGIL